MNKLLPLTLSVIILSSCGSSEDTSADSYEFAAEDGYSDGTYCAEIDYYNPNTGTSSTYTLEVEVEGNELTTIHWPNGGWLDDSHFSSTDISDGQASFTSDQGYDYNVRITGEGGGCNTDTYIEEEEETEESIYYSEDESEENSNNAEEEYPIEEEI